jgi:phosphatidylserine/phosphatidylglycerophosphate/cardiolipin synthase-like enzyme
MDHQLPASSTQHQKAVYVRLDESRNGQGSYLFVGGMDVSRGRVGNWFDAQAEITGRGAELGVLTLEERWASLKGITGLAPSFMQRTGNNHTFIQFVRNYGKADTSDKERGRTFAPEGDFSYYHLLKHAIKKTQSFIYVEDQFFSGVMGLDKLLLDAVEGGAYVVAVAPNVENFSASQVALAQDLASKIKDNVTRKERIRLLRPRDSNPNSLVHTKTWIFDDKLVIVGSGNYWNKSLNSGPGAAWEGELGVAIASTLSRTDFPGVPFAHALRVGMWERLIAAGSRSTFKFKRSPEATFHEELSLLDSPTSPFERLV